DRALEVALEEAGAAESGQHRRALHGAGLEDASGGGVDGEDHHAAAQESLAAAGDDQHAVAVVLVGDLADRADVGAVLLIAEREGQDDREDQQCDESDLVHVVLLGRWGGRWGQAERSVICSPTEGGRASPRTCTAPGSSFW